MSVGTVQFSIPGAYRYCSQRESAVSRPKLKAPALGSCRDSVGHIHPRGLEFKAATQLS